MLRQLGIGTRGGVLVPYIQIGSVSVKRHVEGRKSLTRKKNVKRINGTQIM